MCHPDTWPDTTKSWSRTLASGRRGVEVSDKKAMRVRGNRCRDTRERFLHCDMAADAATRNLSPEAQGVHARVDNIMWQTFPLDLDPP